MIIDCHNHIGFENEFEHQTSNELLKMMKKSKVDKSVIFPFAPITPTDSMKLENEKIAKLCKVNDKYIGFGRVNQLSTDYLDEVDRIVKSGLKGVKVHTRRASVLVMQDAFDKLEKYKLPVMVHTANCKNSSARNLRELNYSGPVIIAHGGKDYMGDAMELVNSRKNYYIDLSCISLWRTKHILRKVDHNKILFASDSPFSDQRLDVKRVKLAVRERKIRRKVFSENFLNMMGKSI